MYSVGTKTIFIPCVHVPSLIYSSRQTLLTSVSIYEVCCVCEMCIWGRDFLFYSYDDASTYRKVVSLNSEMAYSDDTYTYTKFCKECLRNFSITPCVEYHFDFN